MKIITQILLLLALTCNCFPQEELILIDNFKIILKENKLIVSGTVDDQPVLEKTFLNATAIAQDLDNDGIKELIINDNDQRSGISNYNLYIYNAADSFYVVDSISSGFKQPFTFSSEEINEEVLVTGSPDFDSLYSPLLGKAFSPIICWQYNGSELSIVNDKLYEIFISENESMIEYIDVYLKENGKNCISLSKLKQAIASIYANYITADEKTNAEYTLKRYYSCDDLDKFRALLDSLL